jgi:hypothetical protein
LEGLIAEGIHHKVGERATDINTNPVSVLIVVRHRHGYFSKNPGIPNWPGGYNIIQAGLKGEISFEDLTFDDAF